jgi:hypothetical protein
MTMPTQKSSVRRPTASDIAQPIVRADMLATCIPPQQPRATLPNRVFRGG